MASGASGYEYESRVLWTGRALEALVDRLRSKVEASARRFLAKSRRPNLRTAQYIDAQPFPEVRDSLGRLMGRRKWRYVPLSEFMVALARLSKQILQGGERTCFVVDSRQKSSFWVAILMFTVAPPRSYRSLYLAIDDDENGLTTALRGLPSKVRRVVLLDDATYSGEQLSYFYRVVRDTLSAVHPERSLPEMVILVPYMSTPSTKLFDGAQLLYHETFDSLFARRSVASVMASDVFILRKAYLGSKVTAKEYQSLYFDVLSLLPTNCMFLFEHKVADALSIPSLWLNVGPCMRETDQVAYRLKDSKAALKLLRAIESRDSTRLSSRVSFLARP
ncbi:hypothetical protein CEUSTIGMA_g13088.t1, partial [Chlamydomonas eustigma]